LFAILSTLTEDAGKNDERGKMEILSLEEAEADDAVGDVLEKIWAKRQETCLH